MEAVKVPRKVDYAAGVQAGVIAGLAATAFLMPADIASNYLRGLTDDPFLWRRIVFLVETDVPYSIVVGLVIGIIFAATHGKFLKGTALELKGIMYTTAYWLLVILPTILLQPLSRQFFFSSASFPISITGFLIFGLVLGNLYRRLSSRRTANQMA